MIKTAWDKITVLRLDVAQRSNGTHQPIILQRLLHVCTAAHITKLTQGNLNRRLERGMFGAELIQSIEICDLNAAPWKTH